jgi:Tfp pilus assembly protein PilV
MKTELRMDVRHRARQAFSLLEVMVALGIFFICVFSILALVSRGLQQARALQPMQMDAKTAIAMLSLTNRLEEGPLPPEIVAQFEIAHPNSTIAAEIYEVGTNGLFRVDFTVGSAGGNKRAVTADSTILLWRPLSQSRRGFPRR